MEYEYMSWEQFDEGCREIVKRIGEKHWHIESVYGVPRGGLVVAVRLSHLLDIPYEQNYSSTTLLCDDIADTGKTLTPFKSFKIATLYYHKQSLIVPGIWIYEKKDGWIVFPWEMT